MRNKGLVKEPIVSPSLAIQTQINAWSNHPLIVAMIPIALEVEMLALKVLDFDVDAPINGISVSLEQV